MPVPMGVPEKGFAPGGGVMIVTDTVGGGGVVRGGGFGDVAVDPNQPFGVRKDTLWTRSVLTWLGMSAVFILLSVQAVSPTRRWRLRRAPRPPKVPSA